MQAWRASVFKRIRKEVVVGGRQRFSTTMNSTNECGCYQRPRQTSEAESRAAADRIRRIRIRRLMNTEDVGMIDTLGSPSFQISSS